MRAWFLLAAPLLVAACDSREVVSICAAVGNMDTEVVTAEHRADGVQSVMIYDAVAGETLGLQSAGDAPLLPALWRMAETTMNVLPETEPSPCGFDTLSTVTVTFDDGSAVTRTTSCTGNALSRVASEVLEASEVEAVRATGVVDTRAPIGSILEACGNVP